MISIVCQLYGMESGVCALIYETDRYHYDLFEPKDSNLCLYMVLNDITLITQRMRFCKRIRDNASTKKKNQIIGGCSLPLLFFFASAFLLVKGKGVLKIIIQNKMKRCNDLIDFCKRNVSILNVDNFLLCIRISTVQ